MEKKKYVSIEQLSRFLGISRIAVYKKVKKGQIKAIRIGRSYAIPARYINEIFGKELSPKEKKEIDRAVKKTVMEYGEVMKLLAKE